jgi:hypothetical protein
MNNAAELSGILIMDILKKIKLALYAVSLMEVIVFGEFYKRGGEIAMLVITLVLLLVNFTIYKYVAKRKKDNEREK